MRSGTVYSIAAADLRGLLCKDTIFAVFLT